MYFLFENTICIMQAIFMWHSVASNRRAGQPLSATVKAAAAGSVKVSETLGDGESQSLQSWRVLRKVRACISPSSCPVRPLTVVTVFNFQKITIGNKKSIYICYITYIILSFINVYIRKAVLRSLYLLNCGCHVRLKWCTYLEMFTSSAVG